MIDPAEVWDVVQEESDRYDLNPRFVFAVAFAESSFNAHADSGYGRGIIQLSKLAWKEVSDLSYRRAWDWRTNIEVGAAYLDHCRELLEEKDRFSYPLLAASYRYGFYHVKNRRFEIRRLKRPRNRTYQQLFAGNLNPVPLPEIPIDSKSREVMKSKT